MLEVSARAATGTSASANAANATGRASEAMVSDNTTAI